MMRKKPKTDTVLIIEDDADVQKFVARVLELEGYQVIKAGDGEKGMDTIRKTPVSIVLLDLRLPDRDGWSILQEMKHDPELSKIPVVVLTAVAESPQRKKTMRLGATEYLVKPTSAHSVARSISRILHGHHTIQKSAGNKA
jgi:twitching motility two-component system response regulator PilH